MKKLLVVLILLLSVPFAIIAEEYSYSNSITVGDYTLYYPESFIVLKDEIDNYSYDRYISISDPSGDSSISFGIKYNSFIARLPNDIFVQTLLSVLSDSVEEDPLKISFRFAYADECIAAIGTDSTLSPYQISNFIFIANGKDELEIIVRTPDQLLGYQLCDGLLQHIDAKRIN